MSAAPYSDCGNVTPQVHTMLAAARHAWDELDGDQQSALGEAMPGWVVMVHDHEEAVIDELSERGLLTGDYSLTPAGALVRQAGLSFRSVGES